MSLPDTERFGLGLLMPAPVFVALCLLTRFAATLWPGDSRGLWLEALSGAAIAMILGTLAGMVVVAIPAGLTCIVLEWLDDRGVPLGWRLVAGGLLGLASGLIVGVRASVLVSPSTACALAALTGLIVAWTLQALRERPGREWRPEVRVPSGTPPPVQHVPRERVL